jgi:hypothetical protein
MGFQEKSLSFRLQDLPFGVVVCGDGNGPAGLRNFLTRSNRLPQLAVFAAASIEAGNRRLLFFLLRLENYA